MAELDGRGALAVMHPDTTCRHGSRCQRGNSVPAFEYFVETTRAFLNMVQNDTFTRYPNIKWVIPHAGAFLCVLADRFESFALMLRFADPDRRVDIMEDMVHVYYDVAGFLSRNRWKCSCGMWMPATCFTDPIRPIPILPPASGKQKHWKIRKNSLRHRNRCSLATMQKRCFRNSDEKRGNKP